MNFTWELLREPTVWMLAAGGSIILNLISTLLYKKGEQRLAKLSERRQQKLEAKKTRIQQEIAEMADNKDLLVFEMYRNLRTWIAAVGIIELAIIGFIVAILFGSSFESIKVVGTIFATIILNIGVMIVWRARTGQGQLLEATLKRYIDGSARRQNEWQPTEIEPEP
jgi:hypothetical protein